MRTMTRPPKSDARSADEIARTLKLDLGLGFLVRLPDTRVHLLYKQLTAQSDITPRECGVLLTPLSPGHANSDATCWAHPGRPQHAGPGPPFLLDDQPVARNAEHPHGKS
jgi:hypothetical protein